MKRQLLTQKYRFQQLFRALFAVHFVTGAGGGVQRTVDRTHFDVGSFVSQKYTLGDVTSMESSVVAS